MHGKGYYPFTDDCDRLENGSPTTKVPGATPTTPKFNYQGSGCKAQLESGYLAIVNDVHHRRFPLVDEERGVVWTNCMFDMDGTVTEIKLATTGEVANMSGFSGRASIIHVTEADARCGVRLQADLLARPKAADLRPVFTAMRPGTIRAPSPLQPGTAGPEPARRLARPAVPSR